MDDAGPEELLYWLTKACATVRRCDTHKREIHLGGKALKCAIHEGLHCAFDGGDLSRGKGIPCVMHCLLEVLRQRIIKVGVGLHRLFLGVLKR